MEGNELPRLIRHALEKHRRERTPVADIMQDVGVALMWATGWAMRSVIDEPDTEALVGYFKMYLYGTWDQFNIVNQVVDSTWRDVQLAQRRSRVRKLDRFDVETAWRSHWKGRSLATKPDAPVDLVSPLVACRILTRLSPTFVTETKAVGGVGRRNGSSRTWPQTTHLHICNGRLAVGRGIAPKELPYGLRVHSHAYITGTRRGWTTLVETQA